MFSSFKKFLQCQCRLLDSILFFTRCDQDLLSLTQAPTLFHRFDQLRFQRQFRHVFLFLLHGYSVKIQHNAVLTLLRFFVRLQVRQYFPRRTIKRLLNVEGFINIEGQPDIDAFKDEYGFSEEVADALKQLSNEDRDLICYFYGAGYNYKEISELMGINPQTLRKRMERIKTKLAEILSKEKV